MITSIKTSTKLLHAKIEEFSLAWNEMDLSKISTYLTDDVVYTNPPVKIGFFSIKGKQIIGRFNMLKFCKNFWESHFQHLDVLHEEKVILTIENTLTGYIVNCDVHNYDLSLTSKTVFRFTKDLLIDEVRFTKVTKLKADKEISIISLLIKQIKLKIQN